MRVIALILLLRVPRTGGAACVDWKAMGKWADIEAATTVFEGVIEHIEPGDVRTCASERIVFKVIRKWKGESAEPAVTLLQGNGRRITETGQDGRITNYGCPTWSESDRFNDIGAHYIVFAVGDAGALAAMGCGTSAAPTDRTRRRLDKWRKVQERTKRGAAQQGVAADKARR